MPIRVHANFAMSLDGCLGLAGPQPLKLSGPEDMRRVHALRADVDAILVGVGTVLADDPKLTVKWDLAGRSPGKNPLRVVLDEWLRTPKDALVGNAEAPTLLFHREGAHGGPAAAERVPVIEASGGAIRLEPVLAELEKRHVQKLLVEGGSRVLTSFLSQKLVDQMTVYVAPVLVGDPKAPRIFSGRGPIPVGLDLVSAERLGEGSLLSFERA